MPAKGDKIKLELNDLAHGGDCVGRLQDGLAVFVSGGIPGEVVTARITTVKKNYLRANIIQIDEPVSDRVKPRCPVYNNCGGCQLQHMSYETQLQEKQEIVVDALQRIGKLEDVSVLPVIEADYPWFYRNNARFPLGVDDEGQIFAGFFARGSHRLVQVDKCYIQHQLINRIKRKTERVINELLEEFEISVYDEQEHRGLLRHLVVRNGVCTNQSLLMPVTREKPFPGGQIIAERLLDMVPELIGVVQNINRERTNVVTGEEAKILAGEKKINEYINQVKYEISPLSFFQVNTLQAHKLFSTIEDLADLQGDEILLDAYCGPGTISVYLAGKVARVYGIEINCAAVEDARRNAEINGYDNCHFMEGRVEEKISELVTRGREPDLVVVDPPRKGLNENFIRQLLQNEPEKIVYVSCNPATLARDINLLRDSYAVERIQPVDMFPQTYHIETVALLKLI